VAFLCFFGEVLVLLLWMVPSDDVFAGASAMQEGKQRQLR
jgi:hypothetical protein